MLRCTRTILATTLAAPLGATVVPIASAQDAPIESAQPAPAQLDEVPQQPVEDYVPNRDEPAPADEVEQLSEDDQRVSEYYREEPPTEAPPENLPKAKDEVTPGQMRSDTLAVPEGFSKQEADQAEVAEARLESAPRAFAAGQTCKVFWPSPNRVCGVILERYERIGGPVSWLGLPRSNELVNPDGIGRRSEFLGGNIYWHPSHGAHSVAPDASKQWQTLGYETGKLGYPTSEAFSTRQKLTFGQRYSGGDIYYSPLTGGSVTGDIKARYDRMGASEHPIGVPIANEATNTNAFRYTNFSNGTLSWRGSDRATRFMYFNTQKVWDALGRETGAYGFPGSDEQATIPGVFHTVPFEEKGVIVWSSLFGAREISGQAFLYWSFLLNTADDIGYPLADPVSFADSSIQEFANATVLGSGDNISVIRKSESSSPSDVSSRFPHDVESAPLSNPYQARANISAGTRMSNDAPGILEKFDFPAGGVRFVVRKGFYSVYANGNDDGWGHDKLTQKHNFYNYNLLYNAIKQGARNTSISTAPDNYAYTQDVFFVKCGGFSLQPTCDEVEPKQWVTAIYRPIPNNTYKGYESKDPKISNDNWPVGVVTAYCHNTKSEASGNGNKSSKCPAYVNNYSKLV